MIWAIAEPKAISRDALVLVEQFAAFRLGIHAVVDFLGRLPQQEQPARDQDQVPTREGGFEGGFAVRPGAPEMPEVEQRRLQGYDPTDQHQQADSHDQRQHQADPAGLRLLVDRQLVRQDRDEYEIVDPEHDFEDDESDEREPGGWIGKQGDDIHSERLCRSAAQVASRRTGVLQHWTCTKCRKLKLFA